MARKTRSFDEQIKNAKIAEHEKKNFKINYAQSLMNEMEATLIYNSKKFRTEDSDVEIKIKGSIDWAIREKADKPVL